MTVNRFPKLVAVIAGLAVMVGAAAIYQGASAAQRPGATDEWPQYRSQSQTDPARAMPRPVAADQQQSRIVVVSGEGTVFAEPDMAIVQLGVQTNAPTAGEAQSKNATQMSRVIDKILGLGIDRKDIRTSGISLYPTYDSRDGKATPTGYQAGNQVSVAVRDLKKVAAVLDGAVAMGGNTLNGVTFGVQDDGEIRLAALAKAAENARPKAEAMAKALGVRITGVESIIEQGISAPAPRDTVRMAATTSDATPVMPGQLSFVGSVRVTFSY
ncbi:MAG: SIMPL domain-containing protein [Dehalococcoidia bacterium]|nr:SIMPL domain-containing protein [Dehalococcoidia bacterium]